MLNYRTSSRVNLNYINFNGTHVETAEKQKIKFELYKFINFDGTHVETAEKQKIKFELYKFINFEGTHVEIPKDQTRLSLSYKNLYIYKFRRHPCQNRRKAKE